LRRQHRNSAHLTFNLSRTVCAPVPTGPARASATPPHRGRSDMENRTGRAGQGIARAVGQRLDRWPRIPHLHRPSRVSNSVARSVPLSSSTLARPGECLRASQGLTWDAMRCSQVDSELRSRTRQRPHALMKASRHSPPQCTSRASSAGTGRNPSAVAVQPSKARESPLHARCTSALPVEPAVIGCGLRICSLEAGPPHPFIAEVADRKLFTGIGRGGTGTLTSVDAMEGRRGTVGVHST